MTRGWLPIALALALLCVCALPAAADGRLDGVAAVVDDDVILISEVDEKADPLIQQLTAKNAGPIPPEVEREIRSQAVDSLIARKLFDAHTVICASPSYLHTHGTPRVPGDLLDHDCLVYSNLANPGRWAWKDKQGKERTVDVTPSMQASSGDFLTNAAALGLGIVIQPTFLASEAIRRGNLVPILEEYEWPTTPAYVVYPPTRHLSYRVRAFIDFLAERFEGTPHWDRDCDTLRARQT